MELSGSLRVYDLSKGVLHDDYARFIWLGIGINFWVSSSLRMNNV